jgi:hypothetical protein
MSECQRPWHGAKIRGACKTVRENRIPCTVLLETHRCFDQCLERVNITFLGHGFGNVKSRTKGVGALLWGEGLGAWKKAQCHQSYGKTGRVFSFRLKYETSKSDLPSTFRCATKAVDANGITSQCHHIIAGYASTTAHAKAECEENTTTSSTSKLQRSGQMTSSSPPRTAMQTLETNKAWRKTRLQKCVLATTETVWLDTA